MEYYKENYKQILGSVDQSSGLFYEMSKNNNGSILAALAEINGIPDKKIIGTNMVLIIDKKENITTAKLDRVDNFLNFVNQGEKGFFSSWEKW